MYSLKQIHEAVHDLDLDNGEEVNAGIEETLTHLEIARSELIKSLDSMYTLTVKGRTTIDTLLGCMMAVEAIIGEENNG